VLRGEGHVWLDHAGMVVDTMEQPSPRVPRIPQHESGSYGGLAVSTTKHCANHQVGGAASSGPWEPATFWRSTLQQPSQEDSKPLLLPVGEVIDSLLLLGAAV